MVHPLEILKVFQVEGEVFKQNLLFIIGKIRNALNTNVKELLKKLIYQTGQLLSAIFAKL